MKKSLLVLLFLLFSIFLTHAKTVKVGYYIDSGNFMSGFSEKDPKYGFAYEYLQNIASYTGWDYEYRYGYFDELYNALVAGEIDLLTDISYTPEREKIMYFSDYPMGAETYYLYGHYDDDSISADDLSTLNGKTLALGEGSYQYDVFVDWMKHHNVQPAISLMNYDDVLESDFDNGLYDLFLSIDLVSDIKWEPIAKIGSSDIYIAVNHDRIDLLQELNTAQNSIYISNPYYNNNLWAGYFSNTTMSKRLSPKEKAWLENHPKITVGCVNNDKPFAFKGKKGEPRGLITYFGDKMHSVFEVPEDNFSYRFYDSVDELEKGLQLGEVDMAFPLSYDLFVAEKNNEILSRTVFNSSLVFVSTSKNPDFNDALSIACNAGSRSYKIVDGISAFDNNIVVPFDNTEACLDAVIVGEVNGAVLTSAMMENATSRRKYEKLIVTDLYVKIPLCFAISKSNTELLSIVNKLISITTEAEIQTALLSNTLIDRKTSFSDFIADYIEIICFICIAFFVLIIALLYAISKITVLINYDFLTKLLNRRCVTEKLQDFYYKAVMNDKIFSAIIFDLDHFKSINDNYGHDCGDEVLKTAAEIIQKNLKKGNYAFRWGGEEFLVLIKGDKQVAFDYAELVRKTIEEKVIEYNEEEIRITITAGICSYNSDVSEKDIFILADENLYKGKNNGRNQVVC